MDSNIRIGLKKVIPSQLWPIFRFFDKYLIYGMYMFFAGWRYLTKDVLCHSHPTMQSILTVKSRIPLGVSITTDSLRDLLEAADCDVQSGRHSVYLSKPKDIEKICPELFSRYPIGFGLKIIKSRQLSTDSSPFYTSAKLAPASTWFSMYAIGSIREKMVISNLLNAESVAPRVYDIVKLESEDGGWQYAMIVEHVQGDIQTGEDGEKFIFMFKKVLKKFGLNTISIKEHVDLRPPLFRNNIIQGQNHAYYVDIQNFTMLDKTFSSNIFEEIKNQYQDSLRQSATLLLSSSKADKRQAVSKLHLEQSLLSNFFCRNNLGPCDYHSFDRSTRCGVYNLWMLHFGLQRCFIESDDGQLLKSFYTLLGYSRFDIMETAGIIEELGKESASHKKILFLNAETVLSIEDWPRSIRFCDTAIIETDNSGPSIPKVVELQLSNKFQYSDTYRFNSFNSENVKWHLYRDVEQDH